MNYNELQIFKKKYQSLTILPWQFLKPVSHHTHCSCTEIIIVLGLVHV